MKKQILRFSVISGLVGCLLLSIFVPPAALSAAPYYQGKVMTIVVGYTPGSTFDNMARLLAKHLPKYLPGKPTIIIENMAGAGSMIAANFLYNQAKPDGLTIGTFGRSMPFGQLINAPGIKFDLRKFSWIGSPCVQAIVLFIRSDLPYKTFDDLLKSKETINLGGTGVTLVDTYFALILKDYLGLKVNVIQYKGGNDVYLAIERKELDGRAGTYASTKPYIARGLVRPILRGLAVEPGIENLPVTVNYAKNELQKTIFTLISVPDKVGQPYVAPPGTPPEIMNMLREAFSKWAKDPLVREDGDKIMLNPEYVTADEAMKVVDYVLKQPPEVLKEFQRFVKF